MSWELHTARPGPALRGMVRRMVGWRERGAPVRRVEPATTITPVILMLGPRLAIDGEPLGSFAAGPYLRPVTTEHAGEQQGIQIDLEPLIARRLLGVPMHELTGRCVALEDLIGGELTDRVADAQDWAERFARLEHALAARLAAAPPARPELRWAVGRVLASGGLIRVEDLARELGWSRRHLGALFREATGMAPKAFARLVRFEATLERVRRGEPLTDVAYAAGFADQAHLNRDFREFTGLTPTSYLRRIEDPEILGVAADEVAFVQDGNAAAA